MKIPKCTIWLIVAVVLYCAWAVSPVSAHALLLRSVPEANSVLAQAPAQVELLFSELLESQLSTIKVYDSNGGIVDAGDAGVDQANRERMTVSLQPLSDGVYTVSWKVVSLIDGHQTVGSFSFAVGSADTSTLPAEQQSTNSTGLPISALIAKWLLLVSSALLAGQFPSVFFVWNPALRSKAEEPGLANRLSTVWDNLYEAGLIGVLYAAGLGVLAQAGQIAGHELAFPWSREAAQVLAETRLGVIWLVRVALMLTGDWIVRSRMAVWKQSARFVIGLALLFTISLTSHAATEVHPFLPILGDWLHLIGMAFWFGGLAHLIVGLVILRKTGARLRADIAFSVARHFSIMALPSVGVVGLTGIYSAVLRVGSIAALLDTIYGQSLLFKQGFVAALLLIAAVNLLIISPGLHRDSLLKATKSPFVQRFGMTVLIEVILAFFLLANVSLMTYLPPARTLPPKTTLTGARKVDDIKFALSISPGLVGQNDFSVHLTPARSIQVVKEVTLSLIAVEANLPPSEIQLAEQGNGTFTAQGSNLGLPGRWLVEVTVRRQDKFDAIVTFDFNVPASGSASENESSNTSLIAMTLIVLIGLLIGLNLVSRVWGPA